MSYGPDKSLRTRRDVTRPARPQSTLDLAALRSFYEAWGHQCLVAHGAVWFDGGAFSLMSIPSVLKPDLSIPDVRILLSRTRKLAAVYPSETSHGVPVPLFTLRDKDYGPASLQRQFRQQVRTASALMEVRECPWREWRDAALRCDRETLLRRGIGPGTVHPLLTTAGREQIALAAAAVPGLRIQACFRGSEILAYLVHITFDGVCEGLMAHRCESGPEATTRHASHLLYYSFARWAITQDGIGMVCVGRQSVPANVSLARFKVHAGFQPEPYHVRIRLHPLLAPALENRLAAGLLRVIRIRFTGAIPPLANLEVLESAHA